MPDAPTAAQFVLRALYQEGIRHVFMVPGGLINDFMFEMPQFGSDKVNAVVAAHEEGAAYMADGYARASGRFGVCMGIGGPGVANFVPALTSAYADESPVLAIGGEVQSDWEGRGAFQDGSVADVEIMRPITAFAKEVQTVSLVPHHLHVALRTMLGAAHQPVYLSVPQQLQKQPIAEAYQPLGQWVNQPPRFLDSVSANQAALLLTTGGPKIAILAGKGAVRSQAGEQLLKVAEAFHIPVASTLRAKGIMREDHEELSLGVFGYSGTHHATMAITPKYNPLGGPVRDDLKADVLLILGSALSQRDTMSWSPELPQNTIQVDIDSAAFGRTYPVKAPVLGDVREFLSWMLDPNRPVRAKLEEGRAARGQWTGKILQLPRWYDLDNLQIGKSKPGKIHPAFVVDQLRQVAPRNCLLFGDSGAHRAFAGHYWRSFAPNTYLTATSLAPMGWAIAAAIGGKLARPDLPCAVITGDGCMLMHGVEIQTAVREHLKIVYVVINNGGHGNIYLGVKQNPTAAALTRLRTHDWAKFAQALGADGVVVDKPEDLRPALQEAFKPEVDEGSSPGASNKPYVIDVRCDLEATTPIGPWTRARQGVVDN
jgi:acetolactate synthase-1/2/3 large subunit